LITGSFNWTKNAENDNQENLLITTNKPLIDQYVKRFEVLWGKGGEFESQRDLSFSSFVKGCLMNAMRLLQWMRKEQGAF
jgi:phosphatidylserine/phosphatidylglycerophosphate/cardiolipin synthase-like enzyme